MHYKSWALHQPISSALVQVTDRSMCCLPSLPITPPDGARWDTHSVMVQVNQMKEDKGLPHSETHNALTYGSHMWNPSFQDLT